MASSAASAAPPQFAAPEDPHWKLFELPWQGGTLVVYEQAHPEEYNRRFSSTDTFYMLRWQRFDAQGTLLETVDSGRSNAFALHDLPLGAARPDEAAGTIAFEATMPLGYIQQSGEEYQNFVLAIADSAVDPPAQNPNGVRFRIETWETIAGAPDARLDCMTRYDHVADGDRYFLRLVTPDSPSHTAPAVEVKPPQTDGLLAWLGLWNGEADSDATAALNAAAQTAQLTIPKLTLQLDFAAQTAQCDYHYTEDLLHERLAQSTNGRYALYSAGITPYFEGIGSMDLVLQDTATGALRFLCKAAELAQVAFAGDGQVVVNHLTHLTLYNCETGTLCAVQPAGPAFALPAGFERRIAGLAADAQNERILAAYYDSDPALWPSSDSTSAVRFAMYDFTGRLLADWDTGLTMRSFLMYSLPMLTITADGNGIATVAYAFIPAVQGGTLPGQVPYAID